LGAQELRTDIRNVRYTENDNERTGVRRRKKYGGTSESSKKSSQAGNVDEKGICMQMREPMNGWRGGGPRVTEGIRQKNKNKPSVEYT
jgi:hypothetical protein